jgi:hypothetical protein
MTQTKPKVVADAEAAAARIATKLLALGYTADFSVDSLAEIERLFLEDTSDGLPRASGVIDQDPAGWMFALGSYVGEVIRRHAKGEWIGDDNLQFPKRDIAVKLPPSLMLWPVQRVWKRLRNGLEDNIHHYGLGAIEYSRRRPT